MGDIIVSGGVVTRDTLDTAEQFLVNYGAARDRRDAAIIIQSLFFLALNVNLYKEELQRVWSNER